jgi:hypothetical protein
MPPRGVTTQILIDVPLLDKIYTILGQYEELLEQYIASGRLRRLLNSNRMRRKLEKINSDLHVRPLTCCSTPARCACVHVSYKLDAI